MNKRLSVMGYPLKTVRMSSTNAAQSIDSSYLTSSGDSAVAAFITCETNKIRWTIGNCTPTQGASALGHVLYVGQSLRLPNYDAVRTFQFLSETADTHGALQITIELGV